jgi:hypothetical protein
VHGGSCEVSRGCSLARAFLYAWLKIANMLCHTASASQPRADRMLILSIIAYSFVGTGIRPISNLLSSINGIVLQVLFSSCSVVGSSLRRGVKGRAA